MLSVVIVTVCNGGCDIIIIIIIIIITVKGESNMASWRFH